MKKKSSRNTKSKIVSAAWQLFYQQGYDNTTIDEIVSASGTSKGSFYHYFDGKDSLLSSLSYLFDEKYEELMETMDNSLSPIDELIYLFISDYRIISLDRRYRVSGPSLPALRLPIDHQRRTPPSGNQQNILQAAAPDNH